MGVRARRFVGRWDRLSMDVGMDSGIGSDILDGGSCEGGGLEKNAVRSLEEKVQSEVLEPAGLGNVSMGEVAMGSGESLA
jgi:hypothetical protein